MAALLLRSRGQSRNRPNPCYRQHCDRRPCRPAIAVFTTAKVAALSSTEIRGLTSDQVAALTSANVGGLTHTNIAGLSNTNIIGLNHRRHDGTYLRPDATLNSAQAKALSSDRWRLVHLGQCHRPHHRCHGGAHIRRGRHAQHRRRNDLLNPSDQCDQHRRHLPVSVGPNRRAHLRPGRCAERPRPRHSPPTRWRPLPPTTSAALPPPPWRL